MKSPIETVTGRIVGYDDRKQDLLIRAHYDDWVTMTRREFKTVLVQPIDSRPLSDKQRRACYALIGAISDYCGMSKEQTKEYMKLKFLADDLEDTADKIFSLATAPMSLVCSFQKFLVHFVLDWDIPCNFSLLEFVDDVADYVYACLIAKKCVICGRPTQLHHVDHVGTGRDRKEIIHEGMRCEPVCAEHHEEAHMIGQASFDDKYHLEPITIDKTICRIYKLRGGKNGK